MLPERRTAARTGLAALQLAPILVSVVWQASWVGLLLLPAIVWHVQGDKYRSRTCRRLIGGCVLLVFVFGYVALTYGGVAWIGPLVALWLLGEAYDILSAAPPVTTSRPAGSALGFQDRKSTRLNSSHRCISYAVFC